jgi:hypothetical protein
MKSGISVDILLQDECTSLERLNFGLICKSVFPSSGQIWNITL